MCQRLGPHRLPTAIRSLSFHPPGLRYADEPARPGRSLGDLRCALWRNALRAHATRRATADAPGRSIRIGSHRLAVRWRRCAWCAHRVLRSNWPLVPPPPRPVNAAPPARQVVSFGDRWFALQRNALDARATGRATADAPGRSMRIGPRRLVLRWRKCAWRAHRVCESVMSSLTMLGRRRSCSVGAGVAG